MPPDASDGANPTQHTRGRLHLAWQMRAEPGQRLRPGIGGCFRVVTGTRVVKESVLRSLVDVELILDPSPIESSLHGAHIGDRDVILIPV
jgi:hypothetical protein